jgi:hypothetical protein
LAVLKLAILVSGVLALAKLGFLDFITGGFDTGRFGGLPNFQIKKDVLWTRLWRRKRCVLTSKKVFSSSFFSEGRVFSFFRYKTSLGIAARFYVISFRDNRTKNHLRFQNKFICSICVSISFYLWIFLIV